MEDKIVLIVGAFGGIGSASADLFAKAGAKAVYYAASQPVQSVLNEIVLQPESHQMV